MIDSSEKRNRQLAFELQNSHVFEKRNKEIKENQYKIYAYRIRASRPDLIDS